MSRPATDRELTELEGATLGVITRDGPCTSYAVKELFRASPSEFWTGSAGAIYPLMRRLEQRGLVSSKTTATGRRGSRTYRLTAQGRKAFQAWLTDADRAAAMGFDPLRTRVLFLDLLDADARTKFRSSVRAALAEIDPPPPPGDACLEEIHRIWIAARRDAFEKIIEALDRARSTDP